MKDDAYSSLRRPSKDFTNTNSEFSEFDDFRHFAPFEVLGKRAQTTPIVFNSPHSGAHYPDRFLELSRLNHHNIRVSEDMDVDVLFEGVVDLGAILQRANFPRAYLDVNREPYELDKGMFAGELPSYVNTQSLRVNGGLGTIARIVAENREIYDKKLVPNDALARIELVYRPYHDSLRKLLARTHSIYGQALLIDCHSMPSQYSCKHSETRPGKRADIIVGDRYGTSCRSDLVDFAVLVLRESGLNVIKNQPYAGGFITEHYGRPKRNLNAMQIELNRNLYMDEVLLERTSDFSALQQILIQFARRLIAHPSLSGKADEADHYLAAE